MSGHGWVIPNPDGSKARCGGPGLCKECAKEAAPMFGRLEELLKPTAPKFTVYIVEVLS